VDVPEEEIKKILRERDLLGGPSNSKVPSDGPVAPNKPPITQTQDGIPSVGPKDCETCNNRRYKDRSDDPTVSFQTPTKLLPGMAEIAVRAHEPQHAMRENSKGSSLGTRGSLHKHNLQICNLSRMWKTIYCRRNDKS
jgi:hypothetical protein